ncbi:MAG: AAA family ATPase, partial [Elusimicrobia bacterium]|nr:AAA family ATPase [Elusimicrobiota bacterium]
MVEKIYKREVVQEIKKYLDSDEIIVLHGARQVGKTSILYYIEDYLKRNGKATHFIDLEDSRYVKILDSGVKEFVNYLREEGVTGDSGNISRGGKDKTFVFIDEIQYLENPSSFLKLVVDHNKNIKLIVSGSSSFNIKKKFKDSL